MGDNSVSLEAGKVQRGWSYRQIYFLSSKMETSIMQKRVRPRWGAGGLDAALIKTALQIWFQTVKWNVPTARGWSRACEGPGG